LHPPQHSNFRDLGRELVILFRSASERGLNDAGRLDCHCSRSNPRRASNANRRGRSVERDFGIVRSACFGGDTLSLRAGLRLKLDAAFDVHGRISGKVEFIKVIRCLIVCRAARREAGRGRTAL